MRYNLGNEHLIEMDTSRLFASLWRNCQCQYLLCSAITGQDNKKRHLRVWSKVDVAMFPVLVTDKDRPEAHCVIDGTEADLDDTGLRIER